LSRPNPDGSPRRKEPGNAETLRNPGLDLTQMLPAHRTMRSWETSSDVVIWPDGGDDIRGSWGPLTGASGDNNVPGPELQQEKRRSPKVHGRPEDTARTSQRADAGPQPAQGRSSVSLSYESVRENPKIIYYSMTAYVGPMRLP